MWLPLIEYSKAYGPNFRAGVFIVCFYFPFPHWLPHFCELLNSYPHEPVHFWDVPADSMRRFAHPVTFAGMLEMSVPYLPVNGNWRAFLQSTDRTYRQMRTQVNAALRRVADASLSLLPHERSASPLSSTFCRLHQHKIVNKIRNLNTLACHPVRMVWSAECAYIYNILLSISIFSNISNTVFYVFGLNSFLSLLANAISHTLEKNGASSLTSCSYTDLNATIRIPSNVKTTPHLLCTLKIKLSQTTS